MLSIPMMFLPLGEWQPDTAQIGGLFQMIFWLTGCIGTVLGCAVAVKQLRHRPSAHPQLPSPLMVSLAEEFATIKELERVEAASVGRAKLNRDAINKLESEQKERHAENTKRLEDIDKKLDRNLAAYSDKHSEEISQVHDRLNKVAESVAQLFGEMKHVVAAAEKASNAAVVAAEAARGAMQAAYSRQGKGGGHFSEG